MWLAWWRRWLAGSQTFPPVRSTTRHRTILAVDLLEDRTLLSTFAPATFADTIAGKKMSLRDAVIRSNADGNAATDTIQLRPGTYVLTRANTGGQENDAARGDLDITSTAHTLIIQGRGRKTTIDATQLKDRLLQIVSPGTVVELRDLVLKGGLAQDDGSSGATGGKTDALGGAILNNGGELKLTNVVITGNQAQAGAGHEARGGGVYSQGGSVTFTGAKARKAVLAALQNNQAIAGAVGSAGAASAGADSALGGGLYANGATITLTGVTVKGNTATGGAGVDAANAPGAGSADGLLGGGAQGGGIFANASTVACTDVALIMNLAQGGAGGSGANGAKVAGTTVSGGAGAGGGGAQGGGLFAGAGTVTLTRTTVTGNTAAGGAGGRGGHIFKQGEARNPGGDGGSAQGGGLFLTGKLTAANATFSGNTAKGGDAGAAGAIGGDGQGGALYCDSTNETVDLTDATLATNSALGGHGGNVAAGIVVGSSGGSSAASGSSAGNGGNGQGGGLYCASGTVTLTRAVLTANVAQGADGGADGGRDSTGGTGGIGQGGGVLSIDAKITLTDATVDSSVAQGGDGGTGRGQAGDGADGQGGGVYSAGNQVTVTGSTLSNNTAQGGRGGNGGRGAGNGSVGQGGGLYAADTEVALTNSTVAANIARGGGGGAGGPRSAPTPSGSPGTGGNGGNGGDGQGAGLYASAGILTLTSATVGLNAAHAGRGGPAGPTGGAAGANGAEGGGGIGIDGAEVKLQNALIAANTAAGAPDISGDVKSSNHDLVGDGTGSTGLSVANGDQVGTAGNPIDPHFSPLGNHGGLTATLALLPGSTAIDAGDNNVAPGSTDQRGLPRIGNSKIDIGAVEYQTNLAVTIRANVASVKAGGVIVYTITVRNLGPDAGSQIVLSDVLPASTTFRSFRAPKGWKKAVPPVGSMGTVTASAGTMAPGKKVARFTLSVKVDPGTAAGTVIKNTVTVGPTVGDPDPSNNSATQNTTVA